MKKYKLIKEYPGSPELGTIIGELNYKKGNNDIVCIEPFLGEFWEEIIEKDYEILSFNTGAFYNFIAELQNNGTYNGTSKSHAFEQLSNGRWTIQSIKRLSDGQIFTIGDIVTERMSDKTNVTIKRFNIHSNKLIVEVSKYSLNTTVELIFLNKVKEPLFTTEDGVDIYEGDYCSHVNISDLTKRARTSYNTGNSYNPKITKYFSTEEAAEEYILMNKPCLSILDVLDSQDNTYFLANKLKQLVKQKLKK